MTNKQYADAWIKHANSGRDYHRRTFMYPFIESVAKSAKGEKVLDIGCGWGDALKLIDKNCEYVGIDPTTEFFDYLKSKYEGRNIKLEQGELPANVDAPNNYFDLVLCVLVIHYAKDLEKSIHTLFSKAKKDAKIAIVDFSDEGEKEVRGRFLEIYETDKEHIKGVFSLSEDNSAEVEYYFHKEAKMEREIEKYGAFNKTYLGPVFVGYNCTKK